MTEEMLIPKVGVVTDIRQDTPDVKTFRVLTPDGIKPFDHCRDNAQWYRFPE